MSKTGFKKGRLGIGTDNPRYPLDVVGDIRLTGGFRDASGNDFNFLAINNVDYIKQEDINGITSSNSKIGILNTDPSEELDVSGNINFTGTLKQNGVEFGGGKFQDAATSGDIYYNDGNVGIGTTSPYYDLDVGGTGGGWISVRTDNSNGKYAYGMGWWVKNVGSYAPDYGLAFFAGGNFKMSDQANIPQLFIQQQPNGGNVGIGTTSPGARLHVKSSTSPQLLLDDDSHISGGGGEIYFGNSGHGVGRNTGLTDFTAGNDVVLHTTGDGGAGIKTGGGFLKMTQHGNVGIGTTDPGNFKLKIYNGTGTNTNGSNGWHNHFCVEEQTMAGSGITFKAGTETGYIYYGSSTGNPWVGSGSFGFATTATGNSSDIKMVLKKDGNVGIGTTSFGDTRGLLHLKPNAGISFQATTTQTNSRNWRLRPDDYGPWGTLGIYCGDSNTDYADSESDCVMCFTHQRRVGIGTMSPETVLHVRGQDNQFRLQTTRSSGSHLNWSPSGGAGSDWDLRYSSDGSSVGSRLWFWYNGDQRFYTGGGVDRMIITSTGNVGIGTTSPSGKLHTVGSSGVHALRISGNSNNTAQIYATGSNYGIRVVTAASSGSYYTAYFEGSSGKGLYVRDDGNVGIGTTSPDSKLHIKATDPIRVEHSTNSTLLLKINYNQILTEGDNNLYLNWSTSKDVLMCGGGGNVGIGTTVPDSKLHVISTNIFDGIRVEYSDTNPAGVYIGYGGISSIGNTRLRLGAGNTEYMSIATNGKVGINNSDELYHSLNITGQGNMWDKSPAIMFIDDLYDKVWYVGTANNVNTGDFYIRTKGAWNNNPAATGIRLKYDGTLYISGGLHYNHSVGSSDDRIKHNEKSITNAMDIINKLTAKKYFKSTEIHEANYDYTLDESGNPITTDTYITEIGFVAQEVQKIPELNFCVEGETTYIDNMTGEEKPQKLGLSYTNIFSLNVAATQELHKENEALKKEVNELKTIVHALKNHLGLY